MDCQYCRPSSLCRIHSWLDNCDDDGCNLDPATLGAAHRADMPDTPPESAPRSASPKRRRLDPSDDDGDGGGSAADTNPMPRRVQDLQTPLLLPSRARASPPTAAGKKRSTSPVKFMADLRFLAKPVRTTSHSEDAVANLPPDLSALIKPIKLVAIQQVAFLPSEIREDLSQHLQPDLDLAYAGHCFAPAAADPDGTKTTSAQREMQELLDIQAQALEASKLKASEAAWNLDVHGPMLKLAVQGSGVKRLLVTTAAISPEWLPPMRPGEAAAPQSVSSAKSVSAASQGGETDASVAEAKMVDFALVLQVASTPLEALISKVVYDTGPPLQPISQSTYGPLVERPIGVSIETKTAGRDPEKAQVQLSIWAVAWLRRMEALGAGIPFAMPVIQVVAHEWDLSFVCDRGDYYEIYEYIRIGSTNHLLGLYKLLAVLRILTRWMDTEFRATISTLLEAICT